MKPQPFSEITFRPIYIETKDDDIFGAFSDLRLDFDTVPFGLIPYGLRHGDDDSMPLTIETHVGVDFYGVLLVEAPIDFHNDDFIKIIDWGFLDSDDEDIPYCIRKIISDE